MLPDLNSYRFFVPMEILNLKNHLDVFRRSTGNMFH